MRHETDSSINISFGNLKFLMIIKVLCSIYLFFEVVGLNWSDLTLLLLCKKKFQLESLEKIGETNNGTFYILSRNLFENTILRKLKYY